MIQKTSQRQLNAVLAQPRSLTYADGPHDWGQWVRDRHYSLEVTQHPIRARMCGFGDKDRRPLAPAAVAKMIVRREDNSIVDVDDVDIDFFIITVDLWSADGREEVNLVQHPSSADRYLPAHIVKPRKPRGITIPENPAVKRPSRPSPYPHPPDRPRYPTNHPPGGGDGGGGGGGSGNGSITDPGPGSRFTLRPLDPVPPLLTPTSTSTYNSYPFAVVSDPWSAPAEPTASWSFAQPTHPLERAFSAPTLPSIHSLQRNSPGIPDLTTTATTYDTASDLGFRGWTDMSPSFFDPEPTAIANSNNSSSRWPNNEPFTLPSLPSLDPWSSQQTIPTLPLPLPQQQQQQRQQQQQQHNLIPQAQAQTQQAPPPQPPPTQHSYQPFHQSTTSPSVTSQNPTISRYSFTRTLVGPLSANAQRLQDEHRKPGIFFLFQDLSIRTEGTFRLRMRLMNVGEPPAPNGFSNSVHTGVSPVLAQVFTEPFTVYSAKRFPGVPDTTALSIAFGNQGQKLPLRNRHGTGKSGRRGRRPGDATSDEESS